jgi:hypothetical protein
MVDLIRGIVGRIILKWFLKKWDVVVQTEFTWLRIEKREDSSEHGNNSSGSRKSGRIS